MINDNAVITLSSTTESQEELEHSASENWREHFNPAAEKSETNSEATPGEKADEPAEKTQAETEPAKNTEPTKAEGKSESENDEDNLPRGVKRRLAKQSEEIRQLREQLETRTKGGESQEQTQQSDPDPQPDPKNYENNAEGQKKYWIDLGRWSARQENREREVKEFQERQRATVQELYQSHDQRLTEARVEHEDFDARMQQAATPWSPRAHASELAAFNAAILRTPNSAEVLYYLATHPEDFAKFKDLDTMQIAWQVKAVSDSLLPSGNATTAKPAKAPKPKPTTKAPAPITPEKGSSSATGPKDLADPKMSTDEWIKLRERQVAQNRQRGSDGRYR